MSRTNLASAVAEVVIESRALKFIDLKFVSSKISMKHTPNALKNEMHILVRMGVLVYTKGNSIKNNNPTYRIIRSQK